METKRLEVFGGLSFWAINEIDLLRLKTNWPDALAAFLPKPRTPAAALKVALERAYASRRILIRPLELDGAYAVVEETVEGTKTAYRQRLTAIVGRVGEEPAEGEEDTRLIQLSIGFHLPGTHDKEDATIRSAFDTATGQIAPISVTRALTGAIEHLGGVTLRDKGGVYWLPSDARQTALDEDTGAWRTWGEVARAVELASVDPTNPSRVYRLRNTFDPESVQAVADALRREVESEVQTIQQDIQTAAKADGSGPKALGARALRTRAARAAEMVEKVTRYEKALDLSLDGLRSALTTVESAAAAAALASVED